ncbi:MAG: hypothetical protein JRE40_13805 [Deltaproteobacteria bacterium]|nr:hypothetical protein [Deltaproteobacteria bacterium]
MDEATRRRIRELHSRGLSVWRISKLVKCSWQSVKRAVDQDYDARIRERRSLRRRVALPDYAPDLDRRIVETLLRHPGLRFRALVRLLFHNPCRKERERRAVRGRLLSLLKRGVLYTVGSPKHRRYFVAPGFIVRVVAGEKR